MALQQKRATMGSNVSPFSNALHHLPVSQCTGLTPYSSQLTTSAIERTDPLGTLFCTWFVHGNNRTQTYHKQQKEKNK
jgi:hypothetical protein